MRPRRTKRRAFHDGMARGRVRLLAEIRWGQFGGRIVRAGSSLLQCNRVAVNFLSPKELTAFYQRIADIDEMRRFET